MCHGIPMQIKQIDGFNARCEAKGVERDVSLFMLQHEPLEYGDFEVAITAPRDHVVVAGGEQQGVDHVPDVAETGVGAAIGWGVERGVSGDRFDRPL